MNDPLIFGVAMVGAAPVSISKPEALADRILHSLKAQGWTSRGQDAQFRGAVVEAVKVAVAEFQ